MKYTTVTNPKFSSPDNSKIDCLVTFDKIGTVPFTASAEDLETHSIEIYNRALSGEFGPIAAFSEIKIETLTISAAGQARQTRDAILRNLDFLVMNPLRWASFSTEDQNDLARYRRELLDVPQQVGFPADINWPIPPANYRELNSNLSAMQAGRIVD